MINSENGQWRAGPCDRIPVRNTPEINAWRNAQENGNYPFTLNDHHWDRGAKRRSTDCRQ